MTKTPKPKTTKAMLRKKLAHMQAQLASTYHFADATISRAGQNHFMGSGVVLQLTAYNGQEIILPVLIKDGLSDATIAAIRTDLVRSYNLAVQFKPAGVK